MRSSGKNKNAKGDDSQFSGGWFPGGVGTSSGSSLKSQDCEEQEKSMHWRISGDFFRDSTSSGKFQFRRAKTTFFVDAEAMKEKVRSTLASRTTCVMDHWKTAGLAQSIARHWAFHKLSLIVIAANIIWIAVDTDLNKSDVLLESDTVFLVAEQAFCAFFFVEVIIRILAFEKLKHTCQDAQLVFDAALLVPMMTETWALPLIMYFLSSDGSATNHKYILQTCKMLRLIRIVRGVRLLRAWTELMIIIKGMVASMRSVCITLCLLIIIMYGFGVAFKQLTAGSPVGERAFASVGSSMYSLAIYGTLLFDIKILADDLGKEHFLLALLFFVFVLLTAFTVMNMLIGVLCEVVSAVAATEKEHYRVMYVKNMVGKIVSEIDDDGATNTIKKTEFERILGSEEACRALQDVGVDVMGLVDCADTIFMDANGETIEELTFSDFMDVVLELRGSNTATVKNIVELRKAMRQGQDEMKALLNDIIVQLKPLMRQTQGADVKARASCRMSFQEPGKTISVIPPLDVAEPSNRLSVIPPPAITQKRTSKAIETLSMDDNWSPFSPDAPSIDQRLDVLGKREPVSMESPSGAWYNVGVSPSSRRGGSISVPSGAGFCTTDARGAGEPCTSRSRASPEAVPESLDSCGLAPSKSSQWFIPSFDTAECPEDSGANQCCPMMEPGQFKGLGKCQWCPINISELREEMTVLSKFFSTGMSQVDRIQGKLHDAVVMQSIEAERCQPPTEMRDLQ